MREARHLAAELRAFFVGPQPWIYPFVEATDGLDAEAASAVSAPRLNSVFAVAYHVTFWHDVVLRRLRGAPVDEAASRAGGWPASPSADDATWRGLRERLAGLNAEIAGFVSALDDAALDERYAPDRATHAELLHGLIAHTAYHTGEVVTLRSLLGRWDRP